MEISSQLSEQYTNKSVDYFRLQRREVLDYLPDNAKSVLDVGCAGGNFGKLIKSERGCEVWGVEPSKNAAIEAEQHLDKVINNIFGPDLLELSDKRFDAIFFNDVLEHIAVPETALAATKQYLNENGCVIASIPNVLYFPVVKQLLFDQDWKYAEHGVMDNTHLRFFTRKSMERLFNECGFRIERIEGINPLITPKYRLANFLLLNHLRDWKYIQFVVVARPV